MWGHLTRCCQFDDGTRQLAEVTYKDALDKYGCIDMEDLQFEAEKTNKENLEGGFTTETTCLALMSHYTPSVVSL